MDIILDQIRSGVVKSNTLIEKFNLNENKEKIFNTIISAISSNIDSLSNFGILLYRIDEIDFFTRVYHIVSAKYMSKYGDSAVFKYLTDIYFNLDNIEMVAENEEHLKTSLLIYLSHVPITKFNSFVLAKFPCAYWTLESAYALFLLGEEHLKESLLRCSVSYSLQNISEKLTQILKNNGDYHQFLSIIRQYTSKEAISKKFNLVGPISVSQHFSSKYNKTIYIFGDRHVIIENCFNNNLKTIYIDEFIENTINENKDKIIDVFLESPIPNKQGIREKFAESYIEVIRRRFTNCFDKGRCKLKNGRFHYADPRHDGYAGSLTKFGWDISDFLDDQLSDREIKLLKRNASKYERENIKDIMLKTINPKTEKQLRNIHYEEVKNIILEYREKEKEDIIKNMDMYIFENVSNKIEKGIKDPKIYKIPSRITDIMRVEMDIYLMSRIFRRFGNEPESKNIIIYAGDTHCMSYRRLLDKLGFIQKGYIGRTAAGSKGVQCLDISLFKLPFFS